MTHQTAEEVRQKHIECMGEELGELFFLLKQEILRLYLQWNEYANAFGDKESRVELLNRVAGGFARSIQDALWADVLLGLTRLTDPPQTGKKTNLAVTRLLDLVKDELKEPVAELVEKAVAATEFARDWRNRYLAHRDLAHAQDSSAKPLAAASRKLVREALEAIVAVMHAVEGSYENSTTMYSESKYSNGIVGLLYVLDDGVRFDQQRRKRLKNGESLPDDFAAKDL